MCLHFASAAGPLIALQSPHSAGDASKNRSRPTEEDTTRPSWGNTSVERRKQQTRGNFRAQRPRSALAFHGYQDDCFDTELSKVEQKVSTLWVGTGMEGTKRRAVTLLNPL